MPSSSRVLFVNRFYWPDEPATAQLLTDLAEGLAARGHAVTVVASRPPNYHNEPTELHGGVRILRPAGRRSGSSSLVSKACSFLSFSLQARRLLRAELRPGDTAVLLTDPPLLNLWATPLARRQGARVIHWLQDIYPEVAVAVGGMGFAKILTGLRDRAWQAAEACVVPGIDMAGFVRTRGLAADRVVVSPNWAPAGLKTPPVAETDRLRQAWGLTGKFVVMYSGNLGRVHDLDPILDAARSLRSEPDIVLLFVGGGAQKARLETAAARERLANLVFKPGQPRIQLGTTLALADLHLVTLKEGCEQFVFPSKFYGITAVGRPVLYVGPAQCELARTVSSRDLGRSFTRGESEALARTIRHLRHAPADCARLRRAALAFAGQTGSLGDAVAVWDRLLTGPESITSPVIS